MKKDIHPTYNKEITVTCACGNTFTTGSTEEEIKTELCSQCHPFYTGKQKLVDSAKRVEKFKQKQQAQVQNVHTSKTAKRKKKDQIKKEKEVTVKADNQTKSKTKNKK